MSKLIINPTSSSRKEIPVGDRIVTIGRDPSNDLVLSDAMVSRRHAILERRGDDYVLRDNNSSNGTLVNGDRVAGEHPLRDGDLIAIGSARLLFRMEEGESVAPRLPSPPAAKMAEGPGGRAADSACLACGLVPGPSDMYCRRCGKELPAPSQRQVVCSQCNSPVSLPAEFCGTCGKILLKQQEGPYLPTQPRLSEAIERARREAKPAQASQLLTTAPVPVASVAPAPPAPRAASPPARPARSQDSGAARRVAVPAAAVVETPAGFWIRLVAYFIDGIIISIPMLFVVAISALLILPQSAEIEEGVVPTAVVVLPALGGLLVGLLSILYPLYFWGVRGATPGKRLLGLKVVAADGACPIGIGRAALRLLGYFVNGFTFGIGFLLIAFSEDKQGLHDRIAGTRVVRRS